MKNTELHIPLFYCIYAWLTHNWRPLWLVGLLCGSHLGHNWNIEINWSFSLPWKPGNKGRDLWYYLISSGCKHPDRSVLCCSRSWWVLTIPCSCQNDYKNESNICKYHFHSGKVKPENDVQFDDNTKALLSCVCTLDN